MKCGVALKPSTEIDDVLPLIDAGKVDMVLVMTVEPGFGGQMFLPGIFFFRSSENDLLMN